jgi:hypothetical protein
MPMQFSASFQFSQSRIPSLQMMENLPSGEIFIGPVLNQHQRLASGMLVRRMYAWRGYQTEGSSERNHNPHRIALAAWQDEDIAATVSVGRDAHNSLLSESLYAQEIARLRRPGRVICEFSRLAVDPEYSSRQLLLDLFSTAHQYARALFGATDAVIEVNPRHARFYEREFGFQQVGELRICPRVDAPAVLMHRDLGMPALLVV